MKGRKSILFYFGACLAFALPSLIHPGFRAKGLIAASTAWTVFAAKQWWDNRKLMNTIDQTCKISEEYLDDNNNPFLVIQTDQGELESVDTIKNEQFSELSGKIRNFIEDHHSDHKLKKAINEVAKHRKGLEQSFFIRRLKANAEKTSNVNLANELKQNQIDLFTRHCEQTISTPVFAWDGNTSKAQNFLSIGCRIIKYLCNPCIRSSATKWLKLWNIQHRLLALQARMYRENSKK